MCRKYISEILFSSNIKIFALRKSDLKHFQPRSKDVCRTEDGSTNAYLNNDRAIEEFLRSIEPKYNAALAELRRREINSECIRTVAGFAAYVASCAPAAMRIHTEPLKGTLEATARLLDAQGLFGRGQASLGNKSMTELLAEGTVHFSYPLRQFLQQRLGILQVKRVEALGEPAVDRREKVMGLWPLTLIAPQPSHAHCGAEFP